MKVVLDTNVLISAFSFGGKPRKILTLTLAKKIIGITSLSLLGELLEVLGKKFRYSTEELDLIEVQMKKNFKIIKPKTSINVLKDLADNRVLEAAIEGDCELIITGDKALLSLKSFKGIKILTPNQFLQNPSEGD